MTKYFDPKLDTNVAAPLAKIRGWLRKNWEAELRHVFREMNSAAYMLANLGRNCDLGLTRFEEPSHCVRPII